MASDTIVKRKTATGILRNTTIVRVKKLSKVVYRESRTFSKHVAVTQRGKIELIT